MKLNILIEQGFRLYCKMYPSDKYAQGIDIDFPSKDEEYATPGVYLLANAKEEILKIGQSTNLYNRFNRMYKCVSNTTNNKIRKHIKDIIIIALLITCIAILLMVVKDINELYKHIDILNLFYRNLEVGLPV